MKKKSISPIVVKLGGNVLADKQATLAIAEDVAKITANGGRAILVHGGGSRIDSCLTEMGVTPVKKQGLRVTDDATLSVVKTVLDEVNGQLVAELRSHGLNAVGFPSSSVLLTAKKLILTDAQCEPVDLGHVGSIIAVDAGALALALQQGQVPVVAPIGSDASGNYYNVNADEVASSVATFVKAGSLVFLSDVPGVLSTNGSSSIVPLISADDCQALIADGTVKGGMIPKLTTALQAASKGVSYVQIIDGREQGALFKAFTQPGANGTVIAG